MTEIESFGLVLLTTAGAALMAVLSNRLTARLKVPSPALFLVGAAIAAEVFSGLRVPPQVTVQRVVTAAVVVILFDGGLNIGWSRFRSAAGPIAVVGVIGTFLTVAAAAVFVHAAFGLAWYVAVLVATAVAPTDPAVVFSVLGQREAPGASGTILEGESGANDPVGIALMASLVAAGGVSAGGFARVGEEFLLQMAVGLAVGLAGGRGLLSFTRRVSLPSEGLYPLRTLASVLVLYGIATVAHGSGFLAVFVAGVVLGDERTPYKAEVERFHAALASLGEIVAFVVLGLTVDFGQLVRTDVWVPGALIGAALALVIRPVVVGLCLLPARLKANQRNFVLFAGLKGAVPILLGSLFFTAHVTDPERLYDIVVVVVVFSVVGQGSLIPTIARRLRLSMRTVEPAPWALSVRLRDEPDDVHRFTVMAGSPADRGAISDLAALLGDAWISVVVRDGQLVRPRGSTKLQGGDDVVVLADPDLHDDLRAAFEQPAVFEQPAAFQQPRS